MNMNLYRIQVVCLSYIYIKYHIMNKIIYKYNQVKIDILVIKYFDNMILTSYS